MKVMNLSEPDEGYESQRNLMKVMNLSEPDEGYESQRT